MPDPALRLHGFPPLVGCAPRVLVLGSMPSTASLAAGEYYAHPRNAFWPLMAVLYGFDAALPYAARCAALTACGVAVWDVLAACERVGSLDAAIVAASVTFNPIDMLCAAHPGIVGVVLNGGAAEQYFRRWRRQHPLTLAHAPRRAPSTSPAHAASSFAAKCAAWRAALEFA
jgi:hypoxanthine-DNA glycosylase